VRRYRAAVRRRPRDVDAWTGLAVARRHLPDAAAAALLHHPEVVAALHGRLTAGSGRSPDPDELAAWVSRAAP
jgi:hypothetical protein